MFRTNVNEMNVQPIDLGDELRQGVQFRLALAPIVVCAPIASKFLNCRKRYTLRFIRDRLPIRPPCRVDAPAQFAKFRFWNIHLKRTNSSLVGRLCSTGSGHGVLLSSNSGLCKYLADRYWSERDCQAQHRARLEKATTRSVVWFFHRVLLSTISPSEMRWIRLILRVPPLHFIEFVGRDLRQVPDEQNQAPGLRDSVRSVEGGHAAQANSIFNGVVELTIALVLRPDCAQVGRFRIEALAVYCLAPSVVRMARGAMKGEMLHASPNVLR